MGRNQRSFPPFEPMNSYSFILGRESLLSLAEILACLPKFTKNFTVEYFSPDFLIINTPLSLNSKSMMRDLGGTIKIGKIFKIEREEKWSDLKKTITDHILTTKNTGQKIFFGLSIYNEQKKYLDSKKLGLEIKKELAENNFSSRWVVSKDKRLSSVTVKLNKLLSQRGIEILILPSEENIYLGETLEIQPFSEFNERDFGRPGRDVFSGMLPPKLAKIMINLAEVSKEAVILDPFCGSGTIITEAALMNYQKILGSDLSSKSVKDTKINFDWIQKRNLGYKLPVPKIEICDATKVSRCYPKNFIEAIVTEPFLGPPLKNREPEQKINQIIQQLSSLYLKTLSEFNKIIKSNGVVVMVWPVFNKTKFLPILEKIQKIGWQIQSLLPKEFEKKLAGRKTLIYSRPDQKISREIVKLKKISTS